MFIATIHYKSFMISWLAFLSMAVLLLAPRLHAEGYPLIFPIPQELSEHNSHFILDEEVPILLSEKASKHDQFLARSLAAELVDKYALALHTEKVSQLPSNQRHIIVGLLTNPLVKEALARREPAFQDVPSNPEGYLLVVDKQGVIIAGNDPSGAFYGFQSLRQLVEDTNGSLRVHGVTIRDWPYKPFRGIRLFAPGRENIPFFKRFLCDYMALNKLNRCVLEMNAVMRLDRHPELNAGALEFAKDMRYTRRDRPTGPGNQYQDSAHHDAGDGGLLEKDEVADLVAFARRHHIDVIPEIPSLTHSYYLLSRHRELAEIQEAEWPDTYCPQQPGSYALLFDVLDEYIEVMKPNLINVGHDEWRMPVHVCSLCQGKDYTDLLVGDLVKIHTWLQRKGVDMAMWGDHLLENVRGKGYREGTSSNGFEYKMPGALRRDQVENRIPKDILIFNWFWGKKHPNSTGNSKYELELADLGFKQIYANFRPAIENYQRRSNHPSVLGGAPSSWAATTEFNIGKDLMVDFLGCANLLWSTHWPESQRLIRIVQKRMPEVRRNLSGRSLPSQDGDAVIPFEIENAFNTTSQEDLLGTNLANLKSGAVRLGQQQFQLAGTESKDGLRAAVVGVRGESGNSLPTSVEGIRIDKDVSSLIFLHSCAHKSMNEFSYRYIYNFDDTADLLAWYEVVYEDGFIETVPVRYGVNILEWDIWSDGDSSSYCYAADPIDCSTDADHPMYFFAYEWVNPRLGRVIKEVRLKGSNDFRGLYDKVVRDNAVALIAVSAVDKRTDFNAVKAR